MNDSDFAKCETQNAKLKANLSFLAVPLECLHVFQQHLVRSRAYGEAGLAEDDLLVNSPCLRGK